MVNLAAAFGQPHSFTTVFHFYLYPKAEVHNCFYSFNNVAIVIAMMTTYQRTLIWLKNVPHEEFFKEKTLTHAKKVAENDEQESES